MSTPIAALAAAFNNTDQPDTRKTFGNVTYALIPVAVVEAVLDAAPAVDEADDFDERWEALGEPEAEEPTVIDEALAENTAAAVEAVAAPADPLAGFVAREVAVVTEPTDPLAALPDDGSVEVAVASDDTGDEEE